MYADAILPGERDAYFAIELGNVDDEIRVARLQLQRVLVAQSAYLTASIDPDCVTEDGFVTVELQFQQEGTADDQGNFLPGDVVIKRVRRKQDYTDEITKYTRLISQLEGQRAELRKAAPEDRENAPLMKLVQAISALRGGKDG